MVMKENEKHKIYAPTEPKEFETPNGKENEVQMGEY